jgi:hypothetical protein
MPDGERQSDHSRSGLAQLGAVLGSVTRELATVARAVPGVRLIEAQARAGELFLLRRLKRQLDQLGSSSSAAGHAPALPGDSRSNAHDDVLEPPIEKQMEALLSRSTRETVAESRRTLHQVLISQLVPDEARILSTLSDGSSYPLVHIGEPGVGSNQRLVLENASSVGRASGVALPDRVHLYVSHLRRLGLAESGPEDHSLRDEYEILLAEPQLRATIAANGKGPLGARIIRRTLRISDLGRELWNAARSAEDLGADQPNLPAD